MPLSWFLHLKVSQARARSTIYSRTQMLEDHTDTAPILTNPINPLLSLKACVHIPVGKEIPCISGIGQCEAWFHVSSSTSLYLGMWKWTIEWIIKLWLQNTRHLSNYHPLSRIHPYFVLVPFFLIYFLPFSLSFSLLPLVLPFLTFFLTYLYRWFTFWAFVWSSISYW